jgi:hypothetical protein
MCVDCNPLESNTGLIQYSGPDLVICNGNTITNGELLTSVIAKFDNCIGLIQSQLDMSSLVENSPCINLTKTSLLTVLQSILDTESAYCTQLQTLNTQLTALQNQVNNLNLTKPVTVTACDPTRVTLTETPSSKTFNVSGLVPPKTILPYFGLLTDFSPSGLGFPNTPMAGWAIANGNNGTIKVIDTNNLIFPFIKYGPSAITTYSGNNTVLLDDTNIPPVSFTTNANFTVTGITDPAGQHNHNILATLDTSQDFDCQPRPVTLGDSCDNSEMEWIGPNSLITPPDLNVPINNTSNSISTIGPHSHTFTGSATGSFTGSTINNSVQSISVQPVHIQAIPIQWVGQC